MALPHRNDAGDDDHDDTLQNSTNENDYDPIQTHDENIENDEWSDDDSQSVNSIDDVSPDSAVNDGNDSSGGMIDGFNAGRNAGNDKPIKDKINDHMDSSDENEPNDDKDDSRNGAGTDSSSEKKKTSDDEDSDKESSDSENSADDNKKDASDSDKNKKDADDGKDKKDAGDEPKSGIDKWADDASGKMKDRTHGMIKPAERLPEAHGLAGIPARAINGLNDRGNKLLVNAADRAMTGGVNAAANIAKAAVNLFKKGVRIFMRVRHVLAVIFLPPGLWVTIIVLGVITGLLRIITIAETFGPNDIDCNRTEQESKSESTGNAAPSGEELKTFLRDHGEAVNEVAREYNIPANIMIAQAGQESSWGTAGMAVPANNPWNYSAESALEGMPGYLGAGGTNSDFTVAAWDSIDHAAAGYGRFLSASSLWANAFDHANDPRAFLQALQDANYSGGAANYVELIMQISKTVETEAKAQGLELYIPTEPGNPKGTEAAKNGSSSSMTSTEVEAAKLAKCDTKDDGSDNGAVTGTQECDGGGCGYDWMCDSIGVCNAGDVGVKGIYPQTPYGYQCVWYAWQRLGMLHGKDGWAPVMGNGGDIWANLQGQPGWEVDTTPHPGDGVSGHGHPFAGTTHVAVIEKVESLPGGDWRVYVSEGNWCGSRGSGCWNGYHTRWMTKADILTNDNHFFRNTSWK